MDSFLLSDQSKISSPPSHWSPMDVSPSNCLATAGQNHPPNGTVQVVPMTAELNAVKDTCLGNSRLRQLENRVEDLSDRLRKALPERKEALERCEFLSSLLKEEREKTDALFSEVELLKDENKEWQVRHETVRQAFLALFTEHEEMKMEWVAEQQVARSSIRKAEGYGDSERALKKRAVSTPDDEREELLNMINGLVEELEEAEHWKECVTKRLMVMTARWNDEITNRETLEAHICGREKIWAGERRELIDEIVRLSSHIDRISR